jgi:hypothetical protein
MHEMKGKGRHLCEQQLPLRASPKEVFWKPVCHMPTRPKALSSGPPALPSNALSSGNGAGL